MGFYGKLVFPLCFDNELAYNFLAYENVIVIRIKMGTAVSRKMPRFSEKLVFKKNFWLKE